MKLQRNESAIDDEEAKKRERNKTRMRNLKWEKEGVRSVDKGMKKPKE